MSSQVIMYLSADSFHAVCMKRVFPSCILPLGKASPTSSDRARSMWALLALVLGSAPYLAHSTGGVPLGQLDRARSMPLASPEDARGP